MGAGEDMSCGIGIVVLSRGFVGVLMDDGETMDVEVAFIVDDDRDEEEEAVDGRRLLR